MTKKTFFAAAAAFLFPFVALTGCGNDDPSDNGKDDDKENPGGDEPDIVVSPDVDHWRGNTDGVIGELDFIKSDEIPYLNMVWSDWNINKNLILNPFDNAEPDSPLALAFSHTYTEFMPGAGYAQGFTPSRSFIHSVPEPWFEWQYSIFPAPRYNDPFLIACWDSSETSDTKFEKRSLTISRVDGGIFAVNGLLIYNTAYTYVAMAEGNDFCTAFGPDSWLTVTAHGIPAEEGAEETTSTFYLAKGTDLVSEWEHWNLEMLGKVKGIYFTMASSDSGSWGMNTPAYFALQRLDYISFR